MVDAEAEVVDLLRRKEAIREVVNGNIFTSVTLPPNYKIATGPAILLKQRSAKPDYEARVLHASFQFQCFAQYEGEARALNRALFDSLHDSRSDHIAACNADNAGELTRDQETGWPVVISFYSIDFINAEH